MLLLDDLLTLLHTYSGGNFIYSRLDAMNPAISDASEPF